ncbi:MAG: hypothetical protein QM286_00675 [Acidobacteriota bacterium]|nr:hypothetical protein [Acidobacteriota bacterium]
MQHFTVTVERTHKDKYGTRVVDSTHQVRGCVDWPNGSAAAVRGFVQIESGRTLSAPAGADIRAGDIVIYPFGGGRWLVDGEPNDWHNPFTGARPGVQVQLRKVV